MTERLPARLRGLASLVETEGRNNAEWYQTAAGEIERLQRLVDTARARLPGGHIFGEQGACIDCGRKSTDDPEACRTDERAVTITRSQYWDAVKECFYVEAKDTVIGRIVEHNTHEQSQALALLKLARILGLEVSE
jgi:hypothetical protein